jgi:hypothetical protein
MPSWRSAQLVKCRDNFISTVQVYDLLNFQEIYDTNKFIIILK